MANTITASQKQHIASIPGVCGGKPCVAGTRIRVQDIVVRTELGETPDDIVTACPSLSLADVYAALMYYHDNRELIDSQMREAEALVSRMKAEAGPGLLERLGGSGDADAQVSH